MTHKFVESLLPLETSFESHEFQTSKIVQEYSLSKIKNFSRAYGPHR